MIRLCATLTSLLACQISLVNVLAFDNVEHKTGASDKEHSGVSPTVGKSDKKFFGKDYPLDKRPAVDVLHFKAPYPVVQDSNDYDADFVKDENSDDGSFAAQSEYDRLRHKLREEKRDIAKALRRKDHAENELKDILRRQKEARAAIPPPKKQGSVQGNEGATIPIPFREKIFPTEVKVPGGVASPGDVKVATSDTQKAMDALEECKKELADARENLKKLMDELQKAKEKQNEAHAALDGSTVREKEVVASEETSHQNVKTQYKEYMDARTLYLQQQALVAKMEADIKVAASKVKSVRDAENRKGGVYNSDAARDESGIPLPMKSVARSSIAPLSSVLCIASLFVVCLSQ